MNSMLLQKVIDEFNKFDELCKKEHAAYKKKVEQIERDYGNSKSNAVQEMLDNAKNSFDMAVESARQAGIKLVEEVFADVDKKVKEHVTVAVPADFIATLETIKAIGKGITESEARLYLEKYKGNYTAFKSLAELINKECGYNIPYSHYDRVINEVERWKNNSKNFFTSYQVSGGNIALFLMIAPNGEFYDFDSELNGFLTGDYATFS